MKSVYTCFCTDIIHEGHLNIIHEAAKLGKVIVGVLDDRQMVRYNRFPTKTLDERISIVKEIPEVSEVIVQHRIFYDDIFDQVRPDYIVHGSNWSDPGMENIKP